MNKKQFLSLFLVIMIIPIVMGAAIRVYRNLSELEDTTVSSPSDGEVLTYESASSSWVNGTGGGDIESVGDCTTGAALDGTSDGGTYIRLYDGDSNYTELNNGDANQAADLKWILPDTNGTAGKVLEIASVAGDVITLEWDSDNDAGGSTAFDDINDPDNNGAKTISFDNAETAAFTGDNDAAASFFTIQNSDADHTGGNLYLLDLDYSADDGDADADFIKCQDSGSVVLTIQQDGEIATDGGVTAGGTVEGATITEGGVAVHNNDEMDASAELAAIIDDETGTGAIVFATSPTLVTPALGTPASGVATNLTGTAAGLTAGNATLAATVTIADNENANETNAVVFLPNGDLDGGNLALESDGTFNYNPSTGTVTSTIFAGALSGNATTCTTASAGDAAVDFFGAGVDAVTDATTCTDIEGTGLSIGAGTLNWAAASTDLSDTATLLYETELDSFAELDTQIADKALINLADGGTFTGNIIADGNLSIGNTTTTAGVLTLLEDDDAGANFASFQVPALAANTVYTLPPDDGDNTEVLQTDGAGTLTWVANAGGGATAWDDIGDPDNDGLTTVTFDNAELTLLTGDNDAAASFLTIQNTDADHTVGNFYLLDLDYSADDGDGDADFIKCQDSGGIVFSVGQDGETAMDGGITAGGALEAATITEGLIGVPNLNETDWVGTPELADEDWGDVEISGGAALVQAATIADTSYAACYVGLFQGAAGNNEPFYTDAALTYDATSGTLAATDFSGSGDNLTDIEGTQIISTGEAGGTKFLREDGDGTCSWQAAAGGAGDQVVKSMTQVAHGFDDELVYLKADGDYALADADAEATADVIGVAQSTAANTFDLVTEGFVDSLQLAGIGSTGDALYLSGTAGDFTDTSPAISKFVGIKVSDTTMWFTNTRPLTLGDASDPVHLDLAVQAGKITGAYITAGAGIDAGNGGWRLLFDASTTESALWQFRMPDTYGGTLVAEIGYSMASAVADKVDLEVEVMAIADGEQVDTASFDSVNEIAGGTTVPGTAGFFDSISISLANADSVAAGEHVLIRVNRDHDDADDTATGDLELRHLQLTWVR